MKSRSFIFLPRASTVRVEPWAYATDGMNDMTQRVLMAKDSPSSSSEYHPSLRPPPRSTTKPEARKGAFDLGNDGHANSMSLQVDESAAMPVDDALVHNHFGV
ncbi:hypothetical protein H634G_06501 [Metarhizium anisopliae BRIP 53293]|uniref:Uncharacterized protein n=1 Tax=Metarhizium anisopliae BRIP 53293 TaxID=1291518 RepID=A0A0D9NWY0_METAN|nr:hypothetical protein H634G_06501 [Metarhizium anisopliae BRIP 53293]KJK90097.1 hypothetical protein H633G_06048 [Metarhizium anisopliae BRIP 53284]